MLDRLNYLESYDYEKKDVFYATDLRMILEEIYYPRNVVDISNMDNSLSYEYLIALDNKGFLVESVDLGNGIYMETMDRAVEERDIHYLYVQVSTVKPFIIRNIWRYLKGSEDLEVLNEVLLEEHKEVFETLSLLIGKYKLTYIKEEDLKLQILENGKKMSFYKKYFDEYSDY